MTMPPLPPGFVLEPSPAQQDPWAMLQAEGFVATNGFRTPEDVARIRSQGYRPATNGAHNRGDGVDLTHPTLSPEQQTRRLRELFADWQGMKILDEGHHRHLELPGWNAAPGTPGTQNSGLPDLPPGFELEQRGSLQGENFSPTLPAAEQPGLEEMDNGLPQQGMAAGSAISSDPAVLEQLETAFRRGANFNEIMVLARRLGAAVNPGDLQEAVRWRDRGGRLDGHRFFQPDDPAPDQQAGQDAPGLADRLGAALARGTANILGAPVDGINALVGATGLPASDKPFLGSESWKDIFGLPGHVVQGQAYDFDHADLAPQSAMERYAQRGLEFVAENSIPAVGLMAKGGQILTRAKNALQSGGLLTQSGRALATEAARRPGVTMAGDIGGSLGAAVGGEAARDLFPDSAAAEIIGQTVGGLSAGLATGAAALRGSRGGNAAQPLPAEAALIEPSLGEAIPSANAAQDIAPVAAQGRTIDRIDVGDLPPIPPGYVLEEPSISPVRARPSDQRPSPDELAVTARAVQPEDVLPTAGAGEAGQAARRVANINLDNLRTQGDIERALRQTDDAAGGFDAARRGRVSQEETSALASALNMTAEDLLRRRKGQALNAEQALAARRILAQSADELVSHAARAKGGSEDDLAAFRKAWLRHVAIQEQVSGATAEAGRALAQFRILAKAQDAGPASLRNVVEGMGGRDNLEDIAGAILDLQRDPAQLNRFTREALKPRLSDKLLELWYNSILSGPATHVVNMVSNTLTALTQIPEYAVASGVGLARTRFNRANADRVLLSEVGARAIGLVQGTREGLRAFGQGLKTGYASDFYTKLEVRRENAISGRKGEIARIPSRFLTAEDELFKAMARRMEISGLAVRQARKEGLRGDEARQRIGELVANPTEEMIDRAFDYGRYVTFQRPVGKISGAFSNLTEAAPILKLMLPFIRTPTNLFKYAAERSPAAPILREVRDDFKAGGERRDLALARIMVGTGVAATVTQLAAEGVITGGGPSDPSAQAVLRADGWQPFSIRIGDKYYSYQRLDPFATTFGLAADFAAKGDDLTENERENVTAMLVTSMIQQIHSKSWLTGLSDLMQAVEDPERFGPSLISRMAGSMAVPTIVAHAANTIDPVLREARAPLDRIRSRIPIASTALPARRDIWGNPIVREGGVGPDFISPIWESTRKNDPVNAEMVAIGATVGQPSRKVAGRELTPQEYSIYQGLAGRYLREDVEAAMSDPEWPTLAVEDRREWFEELKRNARRDAREDLILDLPVLPPGFEFGGTQNVPA